MAGLRTHAIACVMLAVCAICAARSPASAAPRPQTDAERAELKGPVKDVATSFRSEGRDPDERQVGAAHYDRQGWLTEDEQFTPDFVRKRTPTRIDRNTTLFASAMGAQVERYQFDADGNVTETEVWYGDKAAGPPDTITRAAYDADNRKLEARFVDPDGKVTGASTYKRDPAGAVVQEDEWLNDPKGPHAVSTYTYKRDAHGNWIERRQKRTGVSDDDYDYGQVGTLIRTITYYGH